MIGEENPDPLGEYLRKCPYCHEEFTANHMNREYCAEKNGFKDYCKNRHQRHIKAERVFDVESKVEEKVDKEVVLLNDADIDFFKQVQNNANIISAHLGFKHHLKMHKDDLKQKGLEYHAYDKRYKLPGTELFGITYGPYAIVWGYENYIILTHKTHVSWIQ